MRSRAATASAVPVVVSAAGVTAVSPARTPFLLETGPSCVIVTGTSAALGAPVVQIEARVR